MASWTFSRPLDCESLLARRSADSLERARVVARLAAHMKATFLAMRCSVDAIGDHGPLIANTIAGRVRQPTMVHGAPTGHSTTAGPWPDVTCESAGANCRIDGIGAPSGATDRTDHSRRRSTYTTTRSERISAMRAPMVSSASRSEI